MADIEVQQADNSDQDVSMSNDVVAPAETAGTSPAETSAPATAQDAAAAPESAPVSQAASAAPKASKPMPWAWILVGVLAVAVIALGWWAWQLKTDKADLQKQLAAANANPQAIIDRQTNDLIAAVGKLMTLPSGETPTIANVSDASKAKAQSAFFANAQNGDKVLLYVKAGEAILYRPSTNKIILVAPLTFANTGSTGTTSGTAKH